MELQVTTIVYHGREYQLAPESVATEREAGSGEEVLTWQLPDPFYTRTIAVSRMPDQSDKPVTVMVDGTPLAPTCWDWSPHNQRGQNPFTLTISATAACLGPIPAPQRLPLTPDQLRAHDQAATGEMQTAFGGKKGDIQRLYRERPHMATLIRYLSRALQVPEREFLSNMYEESRFALAAYNPEVGTICETHPDYQLSAGERALPAKKRWALQWRKRRQCERDGKARLWPIPYGSHGPTQAYWNPTHTHQWGDLWHARTNDPLFRTFWHFAYPDREPPPPATMAFADLLFLAVHFRKMRPQGLSLDPHGAGFHAYTPAVMRRAVHRMGPSAYEAVRTCLRGDPDGTYKTLCRYFRQHRQTLIAIDRGLRDLDAWIQSQCHDVAACAALGATSVWTQW